MNRQRFKKRRNRHHEQGSLVKKSVIKTKGSGLQKGTTEEAVGTFPEEKGHLCQGRSTRNHFREEVIKNEWE